MAKNPIAAVWGWIGPGDQNYARVSAILDGAIYRLQSAAKIAKDKYNELQYVKVLESGSLVTTGTAVPVDNPTKIHNDFVKHSGSPDLRVDGSSVPVVFTYNADPTEDIRILSLDLAIVGSAINFTGGAFGPLQSSLTNGVKVEITAEGGQSAQVGLFKISEEMLHFASAGGFQWVVAANDVMVAQLNIGGALSLIHNTADNIKVTIQDNLSSALFKYFRLFVKGIKEVA